NLFLNGKIDVDQLYQNVHERSSLSVGDVKNVMDTLATLLAEELREGRSVHLEGVGYLAPVLKSTEKVTRFTKNKWNKVA
ncbi:Histone-like bacterial DNA-binding protein, partial [gut metagenome]